MLIFPLLTNLLKNLYVIFLCIYGYKLWGRHETKRFRWTNILLHLYYVTYSMVKMIVLTYILSSTVSELFEPQVQKNSRFHVPQPTFLFPLETPLRLSRDMLHGWNDNSVLAKPLAACTYLSSIVSELFEPQVQKNTRFRVPQPHFCQITLTSCFPLETPVRV